MQSIKSRALACVAGLALLTSCQSQTKDAGPLTLEQRIGALYALSETPLETAAPSDAVALRAMLNGLGAGLTISYDAIEDDASGAVARNLVLTSAEAPDLALNIAELRAWGANDSVAAQLEAGQDARLADRIEARGLSVSGFEKLTNAMMDGYMDAIEDAASGLDPNAAAEFEALEQDFTKYDFQMESLVADGFTIHPLSEDAEAFKNRARPSEEDATKEAGIMDALAMIARWNLAASADAVSASGMTAELAFSQRVEDEMTQDMTMSMAAAHLAYDDMNRGDVALIAMDDVVFDSDMKMALADGEPKDFMAQSGGYERYIIEDVKFSKLSTYLARGEVPSMDVADLMSLGRWTSQGLTMNLNDAPYYAVEESIVDLRDWRWFFPTRITIEARGGRLHTNALTSLVGDVVNASLDAETMSAEEAEEAMQVAEGARKIGATLTANGLEMIDFSFDFNSVWNADTGAFEMDYGIDALDFMQEEVDLSMILPTFTDLKSLAPAEGQELDTEALSQLFMDETKLDGFGLSLDDNGAIAKIFALIPEFARMIPEEEADDSVLMLQNSEPEQLRESAQGVIRVASFAVNKDFPPAVVWINDFADFVQKGGAFNIALSPKSPIGAAEIEAEKAAIEENSAFLVDLFGVSVEHVADEAAAGGPQ